MRTFINGSGGDSTANVASYLVSHRQLYVTDLYSITTAPHFSGHPLGVTFLITSFPSPLNYTPIGTFSPGVITRGEVESKIGLDSTTIQVTWSPKTTDVIVSSLSALSAFQFGIFDQGQFQLWRCLMPTLGDCNTLGATLLFSGKIGDIEPDRAAAKLTVQSQLETINIQVPTNLIEPTNILAQYITGQLLSGGPTSFTVVSANSTQIVCSFSSGTVAADAYDGGYIVFTSGNLGGMHCGIRQQTVSGSDVTFVIYEPLPFVPTAGDLVVAYIAIPRSFDDALATTNGYLGFPFVPTPVDSSIALV